MSKEKGVDETGHTVFAVFGYGSFFYGNRVLNFLRRKLVTSKASSGNCTHRGTEDKILFSSILRTFMSFFFWYNDIRYANIDVFMIFLFVAWASSYHTRG